MLVLRTERRLNNELLHKVALFCNVELSAVMQSVDVSTIYEVPIMMQKQGMDEVVLRKMNMPVGSDSDMEQWNAFLQKRKEAKKEVCIKLVGKYAELPDAYKSITEALSQAAIYNNRKLVLDVCHSEKLDENNVVDTLKDADGIVIAPGFGQRGIEGKFVALKYAREQDIPTFGICLGMQCMVIEYARDVLGLAGANSTEMDPLAEDKVIDLMEEQKHITNMGGSMRLGAYECTLKKGSLAYKAYGKIKIEERHRHRYEFNNEYKGRLEDAGMKCTGINPESELVEIVEVPALRWFLGTQFHPEYNSTVLSPNPLFMSFMEAASHTKDK
jgi:CTP synthase